MEEKITTKCFTSKPKKNHREGHRERLRHRLVEGGPKAVQDYEVLEMILFRAIPRRDVKELAHQLIADFGDLSAVLSAPPNVLQQYKGISERTVAEFKIVETAALRLGQSKLNHRSVLQNWDALVVYCRTQLAEKPTEQFHVIFLNKQNHILADEVMGNGTIDHTPVYPREVIKRALELNAAALILVHNHPSGDPSPSKADIDMTNRIKDLASQFNMVLHDHLIIGRNNEVSFKNVGLL